jgi:hypothetical protein
LHGEVPVPFGQQPEIPANYYTQNAVPAPSADPNAAQAVAPAPEAEATVQTRNPPPQQPSPFFTQEEIDEQNGNQPLALSR